MERNQSVDWDKVDDVIYGCVNQAGEDNRNVARMALLLAGLPKEISGVTVNRLCASGLHAVGAAAQAIKSGDAGLIVAGGCHSSRSLARPVSTATTGGVGNPVLSLVEDVISGLLSLLAVFLPFIAFGVAGLIAVLLVLGLMRAARAWRERRRPPLRV